MHNYVYIFTNNRPFTSHFQNWKVSYFIFAKVPDLCLRCFYRRCGSFGRKFCRHLQLRVQLFANILTASTGIMWSDDCMILIHEYSWYENDTVSNQMIIWSLHDNDDALATAVHLTLPTGISEGDKGAEDDSGAVTGRWGIDAAQKMFQKCSNPPPFFFGSQVEKRCCSMRLVWCIFFVELRNMETENCEQWQSSGQSHVDTKR